MKGGNTMKKILFSSFALLAIGAAFTGCSDEIGYNTGGEGRVYLHTKVSTDVKVVSRAAEENAELAANATIWISGSKGAVRKYNGIDEVPSEGVRLVAGNYVAEAWAGDSVPASFDTRWFKGREEFQITDNSVTTIDLVCNIANSVVSLSYDDAVAEVLSDCSFEIGHNGGKLTFNASTPEDAKGYFMMSSYDKDLSYTLTATRTDGKGTYTCSGLIKDAKPTTEYRIRVKHDGSVQAPIGGALIQIVVDETPLEEINDIYDLTSAPLISGIGFDLSKPVVGSEGSVEGRSLWIAATSTLADVDVTSASLMQALGLDGEGFELFHMTDEFKTELQGLGITWQVFDHAETGYQEVKLNFADNALSRLPKGDSDIVIKATDAEGRSSQAVLSVKISDAMVEAVQLAEDAPTTWARTAVITGRVLQDGVTRAGIKYAPAGTQNWTTVWADDAARSVYAPGDEFTVSLTGLEPGTRYEYKALADDAESANTCTFTTEEAAQLPNSGFENWFMDGKVQCIGTDKASRFWDSGNTGAATLNKTCTSPDSEIKHSGNYSAKLANQWVVVKLAAGNIFAGEFLKIDGMDGILGWGRPFTSRPKALRLWVRYRTGIIDKEGSDDAGGKRSGMKEGDMDKGIIYVALADGSKVTDDVDTQQSWPCIVKTNKSKYQFFHDYDPNVIAYGERILTADTEGEGLIEIEIPIEYRRTDLRPSNIILVASASKGGDYYTGYTGSVMHLDDLELVY